MDELDGLSKPRLRALVAQLHREKANLVIALSCALAQGGGRIRVRDADLQDLRGTRVDMRRDGEQTIIELVREPAPPANGAAP